MVVLDQDSRCKIDAVIRAASTKHRVLLKRSQTGHGFARIEHVRMCSLDCVSILPRERGDAAEMLQQVKDHALATEQCSRVVANDSQHLSGMDAHTVKDFWMAYHLKARVRRRARIKACKNLKEAGHCAQLCDNHVLACDDRA